MKPPIVGWGDIPPATLRQLAWSVSKSDATYLWLTSRLPVAETCVAVAEHYPDRKLQALIEYGESKEYTLSEVDKRWLWTLQAEKARREYAQPQPRSDP